MQTEGGVEPDQLRFGLAGEGALNDGTAFPFVMLGLGLLGLHELGSNGARWWAVDLVWATAGGLIIGAVLGAMVGWLVVRVRTRHTHAAGLDEFLSLGLIALTLGTAQVCHVSEFLAMFAAGIALRRVREQSQQRTASLRAAGGRTDGNAITEPDASADMTDAVQAFNEQLEKLAELVIVLLIAVFAERLVQAFATQAGIARNLGHAAGPGDIPECAGDPRRVFRCFLEPGIQIGRHFLWRPQLFSHVIGDRFGSRSRLATETLLLRAATQ